MKGIQLIAAVVRDVPDDLEARELSLAENLHRADLTPQETEKFLGSLWDRSNPETVDKRGRKLGDRARYPTYAELARRVGMREHTATQILVAHKTRLQNPDVIKNDVTYNEIAITQTLEPDLKKQVLALNLKWEDLTKLVKVIKASNEQSPALAQFAVTLAQAHKPVAEIKTTRKHPLP